MESQAMDEDPSPDAARPAAITTPVPPAAETPAAVAAGVKHSAPSPSPSHSRSPGTPSTATALSAAASTPTVHPIFGPPPAPSAAQQASSAAGLAKRRRGLGVVTQNACTECRKKRAKCDGRRPCARCQAQKDVECVYEVPVRQSKENLRTEIDQLRRQQRSTDKVFAALVRPDLWEDVMSRLRNGQSVDMISEWLGGTLPSGGSTAASMGRGRALGSGQGSGSVAGYPDSGSTGYASIAPAPSPSGMKPDGEPHSPWGDPYSTHSQTLSAGSSSQPDTMGWRNPDVRGVPQSLVGSWSRGSTPESGNQRIRSLNEVLTPGLPASCVPPGTWTSITSDIQLVKHLLALYFCWEYPTFASLSKEHFLQDFAEGRARFCSSILVNALLALGCRFSSQPNTRANPDDPYSSGDHFFKECQRLFHLEENHHMLTTIQALGIMSIREASCGRDSESWYYAGQSIRLAIEMGLHQVRAASGTDEDEMAVQSATFWGAFALDHAWSLATGSLPQCSRFPQLPPKPAIIDDIEASLWIPYTDDGAPFQTAVQCSNVRSVYGAFCSLSEIVHQSLYVLHSPGKPLTSRDLLNIYTQYLNWYDRIPEVLRLGSNYTPAVLFTHMYYHFAQLLLFRPFIKLRIIGSGISPREVCSQAADAISGLLKSYSQLYTLRRTPSFVPYFLLSAAITHLTADRGNSRFVEAINRGIADLTEMAPCHHFAEQALHILRYLAKRWNIEVDIKAGPNDATQPVTSSLNFFAPNVSEADFLCTLSMLTVPPGSAAGVDAQSGLEQVREGLDKMQEEANGNENPLFWPFPMQGRPILPTGLQLGEAGFAVIP